MEFTVKTTVRCEIIDITDEVHRAVQSSEHNARACLIDTPHTTCAVLIQENYDVDVKRDILTFLETRVPKEGWRHAEGNSDAHIKSLLVGQSQLVPLTTDGTLQLGQWQGILLCEFDGPRTRTVRVTVI